MTARRELCERFMHEHHSGMADAAWITGARPLVPSAPPTRADG
jgi:hypothetical protein